MTEGWRTKLHALNDQEPDAQRLRGLVEGGRRPFLDIPETPGARRRLAAGAVALALFLGAISLVWINVDGRPGPPVDEPSSTLTPSGAPGPVAQVIGYHGLLLTVPASWAINAQSCGTPTSHTVLRDVGGVLACLIPRPPGISSVYFVEDPRSLLPNLHVTDTLTNPNGVRLERGTVPDHRGMAVYAPAVDVLLFVDTVSEARSDAIVDSIELADIDPNGCAMRERQLDPPAYYDPPAAMHDMLIPGSPSEIAICHYVDNWLMSSASLTGDALSNFVNEVNGLQEGSVHAPPDTYDHSQCGEPATAGGELGSGYVLWVGGIDPAAIPLWAHVGICGDLGIANGAREGQLTPTFAQLLNEPLHHGYVMPGRLVPGPSAG